MRKGCAAVGKSSNALNKDQLEDLLFLTVK